MTALDDVVRALAGPDAVPRAEQSQAVTALVEQRRRVLVVMPTGWGKSAVYLGATAALRAMGAGPTIVVSPLLALMRDQVAAARRIGLRATTVNSANVEEWEQVFDDLRADRVDLLLVSPERLANPRFADVAMPLLARAGMLVIDEAHCISDWGFDFRPDYQRIAALLLRLNPGTPVLATTATANARVTADVAEQLGRDVLVLRGPLARTSLQLAVVPGLSAAERAAWVAEALEHLPGSGIVYCLTVAAADSLAAFLQRRGLAVRAYTGALPADERASIEQQLRDNELKAVVATSALGMGYDKPDLGFCIHNGAPDSPVSYYQQVGRAGRAIDSAVGVLLAAPELEQGIWAYFATAAIPSQEQADRVLAALEAAGAPMSLPALETATGIRRGRLELLLKTLRVADAVDRVDNGWIGTGRGWVMDERRYADIAAARTAEQQLMQAYCRAEKCLMRIITEALDDPGAQDCGRCSVCTGHLPDPGATPRADLVAAARDFARSQVVLVPQRKQWPSGLAGVRGRIVGAQEGRAIFYGDSEEFAALAAELGGADGPASPDLIGAAVATLGRWSREWSTRPTLVVPCPGACPTRTATLAAALAEAGRLPLATPVAGTPPPERRDAAPVERVRALLECLDCEPGQPSTTVLLVADRARSRWTLTVAARLLREAGVTAVLPLVGQLLP
ncbi:MAG: RecQ family ATP-dependent DNA helicase [Candidatus Nanopelagicales bacterium]